MLCLSALAKKSFSSHGEKVLVGRRKLNRSACRPPQRDPHAGLLFLCYKIGFKEPTKQRHNSASNSHYLLVLSLTFEPSDSNVIVPLSMVERTSFEYLVSLSTASVFGWLYLLSLPALMTAYSGRMYERS